MCSGSDVVGAATMPPVGAISERLERHHRALDRFGPAPGRPAFGRPFAPIGFGFGERLGRIDGWRRRQVRRRIDQQEWDGLAVGDGELADRGHVLAVDMHRGVQQHHVRSGDGAERAAFDAGHPRHDAAVAEAQNELGAHGELAALADDDAHDRRIAGAQRHEIDHRRRAVCGLEMGFENKRIRPVAARDLGRFARRDQPATVLRRAEQRGKAGFRIEARPAQPIDRAVARYQRGALAVADQRVVFDGRGHGGCDCRPVTRNRRRL